MSGNGEQHGGGGVPGPMRPGALTALLREIAHGAKAPGAGWERPLEPGTVVGRFEIVRELGRGGFGVVYEARDRELGRAVAFKAVRAAGSDDPGQERLWREAEAAARLTHPNIVTLHDAGRSERGPWLVLELLQGRTLAERLEEGPLPPAEAVRIGLEIAKGMAHAHAQGVVHRDLKPANVFLCADGQVKVLDFGLAHAFGRRRAEGGTPAYMAPEQGLGAPEDERTDVYALGVILHRMLAGELPFPERAQGPAARGRTPPQLEVPGLPALGELVGRMLAPESVRRPRDGGEVAAALAAVDREAQRAGAPGGPIRTRRHPRLRRAALVAAGITLGAAVAALVVRRAGAPAPVPRGGQVTVAVADFANETRDPELDGLSGLLITSLEQSKALRVLTRSRMFDLLRQLGKEGVERIDETLARELGKRAGVQALLLASVQRFDDVYAVEMRALNPARDEYLFTVKEQVTGKRAIPGAIDRISEQTRRNLRETEGEVAAARRGVAEVTTGSLTAWEHFFKGRQAMDLRQFDRAAEELQASVAADPDFALAHYQIAVLDAWTVKPGWSNEASVRTAASHLEAAVRLQARLPEKERLALAAWKATWEKRPEEALRLRDEAERAYPQDKEAVFWAGDVRFHSGDTPAAIPYFERALRLDPDYRLALEHLVLALAALDRRSEQLEWARRWADASGEPDAWRALGRALLANGRPGEADQAFARATAIDGLLKVAPPAALYLCFEGRAAEAEVRLRRAFDALRPPAPGAPEVVSVRSTPRAERIDLARALADTLIWQGRLREARALVRSLPARGLPPREAAVVALAFSVATRSPDDVAYGVRAAEESGGLQDPSVKVNAAIAFALAGDPAAARPLSAEAFADPGASEFPAHVRPLHDAVMAWREGRLADAEATLRAVARSPFLDARYTALVVLGDVELGRGEAARAAEVLEQARAIPFSPVLGGLPYLQPLAQVRLAEAYDRVGERARARERLGEALRNWDRADADAPLVAEGRALRRRLGAAGAAQ